MTRARAVLALLALGACNPVHDDEADALGGEVAGVPEGPTHRPGQPCLLCHGGDFSVAGTVFEVPATRVGADQVSVQLTDVNGNSHAATTNAVGNFFIRPEEWTPVFPITTVSIVSPAGVTATMQSQIGRDGSCAGCHFDPAGPSSPGHVSLAPNDGGILP